LPTLDSESIHKAEHTFEEKQRIKFQHKGVEHHGVITAINRTGLLVVRLDSGHTMLVHASNDSAEPEDYFPQDSGAPPPKLTAEHLTALQAALKAGKVSVWDKMRIDSALANVKKGAGAIPNWCFGQVEIPATADETLLRLLSEKYSDGDTGGLAKSASDARFAVGDAVRDKQFGRVGKVTRILGSGGVLEINYGAGLTSLTVSSYVEAV